MKRFTETCKWSSPWFRKLPPKMKLLWMWLCDNCDCAGVVDFDCELAAFQIGEKIKLPDISLFGGRVADIGSGRLLVLGFVDFQYGSLSGDCRPHAAVLKKIESHGIAEMLEKHTISKGYSMGINTHQDKDKDKDKEQEQDKDPETKNENQGLLPLASKQSKAKGTLEEFRAFAVEIGLPASDGEARFYGLESTGWRANGQPVKDWRAGMRTWKAHGWHPSQKLPPAEAAKIAAAKPRINQLTQDQRFAAYAQTVLARGGDPMNTSDWFRAGEPKE